MQTSIDQAELKAGNVVGIEQRKQSYLERSFKMILVFATLGCIALFVAIYHINKAFEAALPADPAAPASSNP